MTFQVSRRVRTRKDHRCHGCLETIPTGCVVTKVAGKWEGDFYSYYLCDPCEQWMAKHPPDDPDDDFTPGYVAIYRKEVEAEWVSG